MTNPRDRRIIAERNRLLRDPVEGVLVSWPADSLYQLTAEITAPEDCLYHDDIFTVTISLNNGYPKLPPRAVMVTPIFHPNIDGNGAICIACLRTSWNQTVTIRQMIEEIIDALRHPNPEDELSVEAANMMKNDPKKFEETVRKQVTKNMMARGM